MTFCALLGAWGSQSNASPCFSPKRNWDAANRDPAYFGDPDRFDIRCEKSRHIAFGMGAHFCVGAALARTEAHILFTTLMARMPGIRLVEKRADWDLRKANACLLRTLPVLF